MIDDRPMMTYAAFIYLYSSCLHVFIYISNLGLDCLDCVEAKALIPKFCMRAWTLGVTRTMQAFSLLKLPSGV